MKSLHSICFFLLLLVQLHSPAKAGFRFRVRYTRTAGGGVWRTRGSALHLSEVSTPTEATPEVFQVYIGNLPFSVNPNDLKGVLSSKIGSET